MTRFARPRFLLVSASLSWLASAGCEDGREISPAAAPATPTPELPRNATDPDTGAMASAPPDAAARVADLDRLCAALDEDYVDGTLSDYYARVELQTSWGQQLRRSGSESVKPGRELERAVAELDPSGREPGLGACRRLVAYLDDVE